MKSYENILNVGIGHINARVKADDYFPIVGKTVTLDATTQWAQTTEWQTQNGGGTPSTSAGNLVLGKDSKQIAIAAAGDLLQKFIARNYMTETVVTKMIYAMIPQVLPYFDVTSSTEIVRVGDVGVIKVKPENGYTVVSAVVRIYKENETANPVRTITEPTGRPSADGIFGYSFEFSNPADRGIYDVEVDVTDTSTGVTFTKRIDKLITVVPALCPKPADKSTGYEVVHTYTADTSYASQQPFEFKLWRDVNGSGLNYAEAILPRGYEGSSGWDGLHVYDLPEGTTLCLIPDPQEPADYPHRLFIWGNQDHNQGNENGTPNFTFEFPLVITHDCDTVMEWNWQSYGAIQFKHNSRNMVIDGYGYNNTGIHLKTWDAAGFVDSCIYMNNGTSDVEFFGVDIDGAGFAGLTAKTDPDPNRPWFALGQWEFKNLRIHHNLIRNTVGEGVYIGYYDNDVGAHIIRDLRIYRTEFRDNGYDSTQINNAVGIEFCYNLLTGCGKRREPNQGSAFSCTMDGRVYNNIIKNNYNVVGVMWPYSGKLEMFNNILTAARLDYAFSIRLYDGRLFDIHNNVIKCRNIAGISDRTTEGGNSELRMNDNVFITENGETSLPNPATGTGNIFIQADEDYETIDAALKVADSADYNYQPASDSVMTTSGKNSLSAYDMRGYKNWFNTIHFSGPFLGKYKADIEDTEILLNSISLLYSGDKTVQLLFQYEADTFVPVQYRAGESSDLTGAEWHPWTDNVTYTFDSYGDKTLFAQLKDADGKTSQIRQASITISETDINVVIQEFCDRVIADGGVLLKDTLEATELEYNNHKALLGTDPKIDFLGYKTDANGNVTKLYSIDSNYDSDKLTNIVVQDGKITTSSESGKIEWNGNFCLAGKATMTHMYYSGPVTQYNTTDSVFVCNLLKSSYETNIPVTCVFYQRGVLNFQYSGLSSTTTVNGYAAEYLDKVKAVVDGGISVANETWLDALSVNDMQVDVGSAREGVDYWIASPRLGTWIKLYLGFNLCLFG